MEVKKIVEGMTAVEVAEVIDSNFKNQNKILEEDIAKQNNVIGVSEYKDFSEAEAVNVGDVRKYEGFLYECVEATTGAFDASKWKKTSFKAETEKILAELGSGTFTGEYKEENINDFITPGIYIKKIEGDAYHRDILFVSKISSSNNLIQTRIIVDSSNSFRIETRKYIDGIWDSWADYLTPKLFTNEYTDEDLDGLTSVGVYIRSISDYAYSRDILFVAKDGENVVQTRLKANVLDGFYIDTRTYAGRGWSSWINVMREKIPSYTWSRGASGYTPIAITIKKGSNVTNRSDYKIILGSNDDLTERLDIEIGETKTVTFEVRNVRIISAGLINLSILENIENSIGEEAIKDNCISADKLKDGAIIEKKTIFFKRNLFDANDEDNKYGYYLSTDGVLKENSNYMITGYIPFSREQGKLIASVNGKQQTGAGGFICVYDKNKKYLNGYISSDVVGIATWQDHVAYVRFSIKDYEQGNIQVEEGITVSDYMPQGVNILKEKYIRLPQINSILGNDAIKTEIESLNDGDIVELTEYPYHIKKGMVLSFSANIDNFSKLCVGKGYQKYRGSWLEIDGTNVVHKFYESSEITKNTIAHGLTIESYIKVAMFVDDASILNLIIMSKRGSFKTDVNWGYESNYAAFIKSVGSSFNNIKFSGTNKDFRCPVWAIGDSYFGVSSNRWVGVMRGFGFFNMLIDGLAGQSSSGAYNDLNRLLNYGTPKYLLWCLGMNDNDSAFKTYFDRVKSLCKEKSITMIASTIPTVPSRDKEVVTQYVKDSGVRYIDFYTAVGADSNGNWYEGYLSSDGVHPTALGAQALAMQVLIDFPELMQYGLVSTDSEIGDITGDL